MKNMRILFLIYVQVIISNLYVSAEKNYEGYAVLHVTCRDSNERTTLIDTINSFQLDVWKGGQTNKAWHVMVRPEDIPDVTHTFNKANLNWGIHIDSVQQQVEESMKKRTRSKAHDYNGYNEFEAIQEELEALSADCPGGFDCEIYTAGFTYEGFPLNVLRVSKPNSPFRRGYWLDAMMHAREWIAGATHMNIAQRLIRGYANNSEAQYLMDSYDWYLLPVVNVDGYVYTWTDDRLWRKNRTPNNDSDCIGTDLNRNYEYRWGEVGSSDSPCSGTYQGSGPNSEPVTQVLVSEMNRLSGSLDGWITLHSYSQFWMTPWAFTENSPDAGGPCAFPDDYDDLFRVSQAACTAAEGVSGDTWEPGSWCEVLYDSSGVAQDHAKSVGIKYVFTPELRGDSFIVDESEIPISFEEVWAALVAVVSESENVR